MSDDMRKDTRDYDCQRHGDPPSGFVCPKCSGTMDENPPGDDMRKALELARQFIDPDRDPPRIGNRELVKIIDTALAQSRPVTAGADDGARNAVSSLHGQIAAIYGNLDAEDCKWVDREWAKMRGYILPTDGTSTLTILPAGTARETATIGRVDREGGWNAERGLSLSRADRAGGAT